jgi:hypothetical protein
MSLHQPTRDARRATRPLPSLTRVATRGVVAAAAPPGGSSDPEPIAVSMSVDSVGPRATVRLLVNRAPEQLTNLFCNVTSLDGRVRPIDGGSPVVVSRSGQSHYRIVIDDLAPDDYVFTTCAVAKNGVDAMASDIFTIRSLAGS